MKSNHIKSKYFNLFLILELVENSGRYEKLFSESKSELLFTEEDRMKINELIESINGENTDRRKQTLNQLLTKTKKSRHTKLYEMLINIDIGKINFNSSESPQQINESIIKKLIDTRNKLLHRGETFDENIV